MATLTSLVTVLYLGAFSGICRAMSQEELNTMANDLQVRLKIVDNINFERKHRVKFFLTNTGSQPFPESNWTICMDSFRSLEPDLLPYTGSVLLPKQFVNISFVQGQFSQISPSQGFGQILPNQTRTLTLFAELFSVGIYDNMPNWYLTSGELEPVIIPSTREPELFVAPFTTPEQWRRNKDDVYNPFSPEERLERDLVRDLETPGKLVIPTPLRMSVDNGNHTLVDRSTWAITADRNSRSAAKFLSEKSGYSYTEESAARSSKVIQLVVNASDTSLSSEGYMLIINPSTEVIRIEGQSSQGAFYGVQTFLSLLESFPNRTFPNIEIKDRPRFGYRGMHLDVARNFHGSSDVLRLIDTMATYKMNKLHLHLSDDDGWRLEIPGLSELTEVAGRRCHDMTETRCLLPQLGSGPFTNTSGSGYFTGSDYRSILKHARRRYVQVIPEFDMPGHAHAAIRAMESRFLNLDNTGNSSAASYFRLEDPEDQSKYLSVQEFKDNAMNPCIESTYRFIEHVVKAVKELHNSIQPLDVFHFGGDEVAKGAWVNSSACERLKERKPDLLTPADLKRYFVKRVADITSRNSLNLAGWEDGFMGVDHVPYPRDLLTNQNVYAYAWNNVWEWQSSQGAYRLANGGYKVVMSHATHLYFDHPHEPDPEERGLTWATRFTDTSKVFGFMPDSLYENIDTLLSGEPTNKLAICGANMENCDPLRKRENIIGIQGQLWTEITRTGEQMDYMIYPRLLALAERAWHKASWEELNDPDMRTARRNDDWEAFANSLGHKELQRLDKAGIRYRVPPPGTRVLGGVLETGSAYPGLAVEMSLDTGRTWRTVGSKVPKPGSRTILLRTRSADGKRTSRIISFDTGSASSGSRSVGDSRDPGLLLLAIASIYSCFLQP